MTQELMQRLGIQSPETAEKVEQFLLAPVSYTHLTLPTILLV